jgi:hypothetical protein
MTAASPPFLENPLYINRVIEIQQSWYNENNCLQQSATINYNNYLTM